MLRPISACRIESGWGTCLPDQQRTPLPPGTCLPDPMAQTLSATDTPGRDRLQIADVHAMANAEICAFFADEHATQAHIEAVLAAALAFLGNRAAQTNIVYGA